MPSVVWKIKKKKLFSIIFQFFTYFLHWPHECSKFFFAERGQVQNLLYKCWTSGYFTEWFFRMLPRPRQPGSLDCGRAPWTAMKSTSQNKMSFMVSCRTQSPFIPPVPPFFTLTSPGNNTAMAAGWGWRPHIAYLHLRTCKPGWIPRRPQVRSVPSPNTHSTIQNEKMESTTMVSPCMATLIFSILSIL